MITPDGENGRIVREVPERTTPQRQIGGAQDPAQASAREKTTTGADFDPYQVDPDLLNAGREAAGRASSQGEQAVLDGYWLLGQWARAQATQHLHGSTMGLDPLADLGGQLPDWIARMGLDNNLLGRYVQWWVDYLSGAVHATKRFYGAGMGPSHDGADHWPMPPGLNTYYRYPHHQHHHMPGYPLYPHHHDPFGAPPFPPGCPPFHAQALNTPVRPQQEAAMGGDAQQEHVNPWNVEANAQQHARAFGGPPAGSPAPPPFAQQPAPPPQAAFELRTVVMSAKFVHVHQQWTGVPTMPVTCELTLAGGNGRSPEARFELEQNPPRLLVTVADDCDVGTHMGTVVGATGALFGRLSVTVEG